MSGEGEQTYCDPVLAGPPAVSHHESTSRLTRTLPKVVTARERERERDIGEVTPRVGEAPERRSPSPHS